MKYLFERNLPLLALTYLANFSILKKTFLKGNIMTFSEQLNEYLSILNCSAKELSQISGLSNSVISRYRSGERVPRPESEKLNQLCEGIYLLSKEKAASKRTSASITPFTKDEIYTAFTNTLKQPDNSQLCENFNHLLLASSVSLADLARFLNYDS